MNDTPIAKTPIHFRVIALIAVLWNAVAAFDFVGTFVKCPRHSVSNI